MAGFAETYRDDSGLDYALNRYYASSIGRFLSVDRGRANLGDPQSLNRFRYAGNDPVNRLDPSGLDDDDLVTFYGFSYYTYLNVVASIGGVRSGGGGSRAHGMAEVAIPEPAEPDGGGYDPRADFRDYAVQLSNNRSMNDCEKLALMAYKAGQVSSSTGDTAEMIESGLTERSGAVSSSDPNYRVGVFKRDLYYASSFLDSGFTHEFQDNSNQVRHFAGWFAAGYLARLAPEVARQRLYGSENSSDPADPDVALGLAAISLGASFSGDSKKLAQGIWHTICGQTSNLKLP